MKSRKHACQHAYSMRFFKHIGLRAAWNMRSGGMLFWFDGRQSCSPSLMHKRVPRPDEEALKRSTQKKQENPQGKQA
jgi:hypothetical protein